MDLGCWLRRVVIALCVAWLPVSSAAAQSEDPGALVQAYLAAMNAQDVTGALSLFDEYGSATDIHGRTYEGQAGLTEFLVANGFAATSNAHVSTDNLIVAGNRAIWTYSCSCTSGQVQVRMVLQHNKISVFAMSPPAPGSAPRAQTSTRVAWLPVLALVGLLLALALGLRSSAPAPTRRPVEGRLLLALREGLRRD